MGINQKKIPVDLNSNMPVTALNADVMLRIVATQWAFGRLLLAVLGPVPSHACFRIAWLCQSHPAVIFDRNFGQSREN